MRENPLDLTGRIVVVAGASGGGLGSAVTRMAAENGATVIAVSRSQEKLDEHVGPLIEQGLAVITVTADVEEEAGVTKVMDAVRDAPGKLHGLVTVVGGGPPPSWGNAGKLPRNTWHELFSKNLDSMFFISQAVTAELRRQKLKGSVVAISSITAIGAQPYNVAYGAAKAAVLSVVRTMALELAAEGIRVNAVAPGAMTSPASLLPPNPELERQAIPMGRKGDVAEIANSVLFLLSDMGSYLTGQCLTVDGGISVKWSHLREDNTPLLITNEPFLTAMKAD
ncbi:SDR family NAD(P)-dependent oxidoreductase [Zhongshania aquimaris]|uniref:SDR family oxidoreductase n=1 Tax=Zhongshania aquimaris TaxID=2857107 RepID=A0ABS6VYH0_9GAMM|nr:SDR family oxidoreductase [Zhongshania aquimaris]MBW2942686.1 SDR family oxidoreductase [Zhongshania aquimaris]